MINNIASVLEGVTTAAIAGHVRPDGDCVGSCMGMYLYLKENYPQIQTDVYLEEVPEVFHFIQDIDQAKQEWEEKEYDLFLEFDVSSTDRIGVAGQAVNTAKITACIDHHITNKGIAQKNQIVPDATSGAGKDQQSLCGSTVYRDRSRYRCVSVQLYRNQNHGDRRSADGKRH